jgi:tetratricopeptide (TPR) repeat protein
MYQAKRNLTVGLFIFLSGMLLAFPQRSEAFVYQDRIAYAKSLAHYTMGQIYDLLGQSQQAIEEYQKASQYDEGSYIIHLRLGADFARLDMLSKAKDELYLVNQYNPDDLQSHYLLALIHSTEKDFEKAASEYEHILKSFSQSEPDNVEIYGYLGQLYYSQRKYKQAIEQFEKMLSLDDKNADVMYMLGSLYIEVKENDKAIAILKKSIEIDPDHDGSLNSLAYLYADNDSRLDEAFKMIQKALELSPNNGAYLDTLGWIYYKKNDYKKALETLQKADQVLKDPVIYDHLADVYLKLNMFDDAIKHWELSLKLMPTQEDVKKKLEHVKGLQAKKEETSPIK